MARDVVIRLGGDEQAGLRIAELSAWGVTPDGDVLNGVRLADRFDARGVEAFGLETLVEKQTTAYIGLIESGMEGLSPEAGVEMDLDTTIERYDVAADRVIVDGLIIHANEGANADETDDANANSFKSVLKLIADSNRGASFDMSAVYGLQTHLIMEQTSGKTDMSMTAPFMAASGWRRGDLDFSAIKDLAFNFDTLIPATDTVDPETGEAVSIPELPMQMGGGYDFFSIEGVKLARLYEYLAAGAAPPASETDLMSLGVWRIRGERQTFGGREISSVEEATIDLAKFHWLIPTDIRFTAKGGKYDMAALFGYVQDMAAQGAGDEAGLAQMQQLSAALEENGLDVVAYDMEMAAEWNPDDGMTASLLGVSADELGDWRQSFNGRLPDFEDVKTLLPAEGDAFVWTGVTSKLLEASALHKASIVLADKGGIDKGFAMAVAMAKLAPEEDASAAMLRNADPADLRISSAAMVRMTAPQAAQAFPPAAEYLVAFADFIQKGGVLRAEANPPAPVTAALLESEADAIQADPGRLAEILGLSVVREDE